MNVFIIKLTIFIAICLNIITIVLVNYGGNVGYFYEKFTTPKAKSTIIADSRGFQGIQPSVIDKYFEGKEYDNEEGEFRQADQPPHNMNFVNINLNYEYLKKNLVF